MVITIGTDRSKCGNRKPFAKIRRIVGNVEAMYLHTGAYGLEYLLKFGK